MHSTITQARYDATAATERHLRYNGASLCDLLDRIGYERRLPASEMTRWHGARFSDILTMFPRAR